MGDISAVVAFIIGLAIILLASILNAAGLNLTKLDHVRTSAVPKHERRRDWMRPLWLLGMLLYILSQVIGSTLALEYMRAEYVAPLGSSSLVFNFLFARFLVGTPVTSTDIYGTIVVVVGVIGIVAFGSINSGLTSETNAAHLARLWARPGWLAFFFTMATALYLLLVFTAKLDALLAARAELDPPAPKSAQRAGEATGIRKAWAVVATAFGRTMSKVEEAVEWWSANKDDTQIAWTLGIGWACCGGGLAGGCLVFAKATVKLLSGSLSHANPGNQFGHVAPIFTIILLATTAVLQIICLNRGLRVYDSTLVVPVFYGVYTAAGFLDSLIFNNEVDSYKSWTLFLITVSILVLISGVVLLTHKKPEAGAGTRGRDAGRTAARGVRAGKARKDADPDADVEMHPRTSAEEEDGEQAVLWAVGEESDEEDVEEQDGHEHEHDAEDGERTARPALPAHEAEGEAAGLLVRNASADEFGGWASASAGAGAAR